jgi:hypothetical protein
MKTFQIVLFLLMSGVCFSQASLSEENAKQYIDVFFDGFHKQDTVKMRSVMVNNINMYTAYKSKIDGDKVSLYNGVGFLKMVASREEGVVWEERLLDYKINIDGNLASVWTPYQFYINGELSHCGANLFTLVATNDGWKIMTVVDSRRVKCDG